MQVWLISTGVHIGIDSQIANTEIPAETDVILKKGIIDET